VDLSGVQMTVSSAIILSDILTIEWGLRKLILKECNLDEHVMIVIRPMRHFVFNLFDRILNPCYMRC